LIPQKIVNAVVPRSDVDNLKVKNLPPHYTNPLKRHQSLFETVARLVKKLETHNYAFISVLHDDNHKEYICPPNTSVLLLAVLGRMFTLE
jgi:hypothetical protein